MAVLVEWRMVMKDLLRALLFFYCWHTGNVLADDALASTASNASSLSLNGFKHWITGSDPKTIQLLPSGTENGLVREHSGVVAHVKFTVTQYGEMSFPIDPRVLSASEAGKVDLSGSRYLTLNYKANHPVVLQLRQTGVHGGIQNHVVLPATTRFVTRKVYFSEFAGGLKPLDLTDVAKFNFAFLANNESDGFAELVVKSFHIEHFKPQ